MAADLYREIQKQLDRYSLGFPATESGIELKILKKLFRKEDAELFSEMTQNSGTDRQKGRQTA
jgi:electron transport complex protein RnfB